MSTMNMGELGIKVHAAADMTPDVVAKKLATLAQVGVGYEKSAIQEVHAVDTGTMLNSTTAEKVDDSTYLIGPTVFYAPYVALGTEYVDARPFHLMAASKLQTASDKLFTAKDIGL